MSSENGLTGRQRNRAAALEYIRRAGGCSRNELMDYLGLSRGGVAHLVNSLLETHDVEIVEEDSRPIAKRGRPASKIIYKSPPALVVGIDFGHTHVTVAIADLGGRVLAERTIAYDVNKDAPGACAQARVMLDGLLYESGAGNPVIYAVAGIPISIDRRTGGMRANMRRSSWAQGRPQEIIENALGMSVRLEHDTNLGALGEMRVGSARGLTDALYIKISSGIGAGLIFDGKIYPGSSGFAGEIGHIKVPGSSELCRCGSRGCLEALAGIEPVARQLSMATRSTIDESGRIITPGHDPAAERILMEAGWTIGRLIADLANCLDPQTIILGGRLGAENETVREGVAQAMMRHAEPAIASTIPVRRASLGQRAEIVGAVTLAVDDAVVLLDSQRTAADATRDR
ncbi:ROK family transcriptional regulator [Rarobacter incanus]|uniref:Putative NBD/HSP70 family sugar kinase n=1 Tax=Rarobacter incanus TaxID=153494 RepID=A0A542SQF5_9MICO|nr:ROK family protein [Rarobacter incanus]TQK76843.1 putative NBD/HSP70 family sugar kinase [Rarobacter incanus]